MHEINPLFKILRERKENVMSERSIKVPMKGEGLTSLKILYDYRSDVQVGSDEGMGTGS